jgi:hypothetical protein
MFTHEAIRVGLQLPRIHWRWTKTSYSSKVVSVIGGKSLALSKVVSVIKSLALSEVSRRE